MLLSETWEGAIAGKITRSYHHGLKLNDLVLNGNTIDHAYDDDGLLVRAGDLKLTRNADNGILTGTALAATTTSQSYNAFGELSQLIASQAGDTMLAIQYTRDKAGRITRKTETIAGQTNTTNYSYDLAGRLVKVEKDGASITYRYDSNGNRLSRNNVTGTYDPQDRLLTYGNASYSYTANGELKTRASGGQTTAYRYDVRGNLTNVTLPDGTTIEYLADGRNRRIAKKVNGAKVQGFLYQSQLRPIAELDGNGNIVSRFVYATGINVPNYMIKGGMNYRMVTDHLGSPRLVINTATGIIAQRMDYDEFGNVTHDTNPGFQPFGFAGGLYDRDTKLVRFGARDYNAEAGRWTAKDPIGFAGGDANLYGYIINDPLNSIDPAGLEGIVIGAQAGGVIGFVMGAGVEVASGVYIGTEGIYQYHTLGGGFALGRGMGASISAGYVWDFDNFWGYGNEMGVNFPDVGLAICQSNPDANTWGKGPLVSAQLSKGPSLGFDGHWLKTYTWKGPGFSWSEFGAWLEGGIRQIYGVPLPY
ncbi:MAG: hypothetical protein DU489_04600 [Nitrosomonas sp.]